MEAPPKFRWVCYCLLQFLYLRLVGLAQIFSSRNDRNVLEQLEQLAEQLEQLEHLTEQLEQLAEQVEQLEQLVEQRREACRN